MLARTVHPCDIHAIARMCGVKLHNSADNRSSGRKPGHCYCKPTVRAIGRRHGEQHLAMVLKLINSTGNGHDLHAATLQAVSAVLLTGEVELNANLFLAMDEIDLGRLRVAAKALPGSTADVMAGALLALLTGPAIARRVAC
ncbi:MULTISPECIES: hypothetical protein [unclassified Mesorhizobium]|uniref:hypothetical protein n=1 Tax=unclassified Mesorhizobium TaxID=325217 RepID=UPI000FCB18A9|nr:MULTISPECIES: hypothetical protein [unclassified Mesorhizobium]RUU65019.1 hypothetical protein EOC99_10690 [Mesorhizobium sp. M7A.T.Ca.TU.009.01.1.1]RUU77657.1 hypothetical protein EOD03_21800 [Mesorhizobium sp. M7A.T.Ca.TU.009.01.1.2]RUT88127.1 hypothetical protein EOD14_07945 [Mesorhizobium sp. M7A.T.Ca.US.000.02.1.1]RUT91866.1 hypothetical protein EOD15_12880 [Mesorhizobium sp. M7A.T.Ca.US.000.02.2.1]RUT99731.1 hypothetical protein EOD12_21105 [Mesorhizobium sp. M7A.T.Ca.TU.009.02.1.1]